MKLNEALQRVASAHDRPAGPSFWLVCGFEALHLRTFLQAAYIERARADRLEIATGAFGDLEGNLKRALESEAAFCAVFLEWNDLDPRLGLRSRGSWSGDRRSQILGEVEARFARLRERIAQLSRRATVAVCPPTLGLPWGGTTALVQHSPFELALEHMLASFSWEVGQLAGVRVLHPGKLAEVSPASARHAARSELSSGFPYRLPHASALASLTLSLLLPATPKKAVITDLDDTLWRGLLGEVGPEAVAWTQEHGAQVHGLYQAMLQQLVDSGALVGVVSKNDPELALLGLARADLFVAREALFPVLASWGPKSQAVTAVLAQWNLGAEAVVFVDDNPMELDEVARVHPQLTCKLFPKNDPAKVLDLLVELRELFGAPFATAEDQLRARSIRASAAFEQDRHGDAKLGEFLEGLAGRLTFTHGAQADLARAHQLINKTNQFNLNGLRTNEAETRALAAGAGRFLLLASYTDRYGPLGTVGALGGRLESERLVVAHWVLSCRAFSRNIEHHMLRELVALAAGRPIVLEYQQTARNGPFQLFLESLGVVPGAEPVRLATDVAPRLESFLPHAVSSRIA